MINDFSHNLVRMHQNGGNEFYCCRARSWLQLKRVYMQNTTSIMMIIVKYYNNNFLNQYIIK